MPSLTLTTQPGFTEIPDTAFDAGQPATAANLKALNSNAKFDAVRSEHFQGYYKHGESVQLPISPADAYQYQRAELLYHPHIYWTGAPPTGPLNGAQEPPSRGATSGEGNLLQFGFDIDAATGLVNCLVSYFKTSQQDTNDGILFVTTIAVRQR